MIDFSRTKTQEGLYQSIVRFAQANFNEGVVERDQDCVFDRPRWQKFQQADFFRSDRCLHSAVDTVVALEALGYGSEDGGLNFSISAHWLAGVRPIVDFGTDLQLDRLFLKICDGSIILANAITEESSGSDAFEMATIATSSGEHYVLNGLKTYCSNGPVADMVLVYALTDVDRKALSRFTCFLLPTNREGVHCGPAEHKLGLRTCPMGTIRFENVAVTAADILGGLGGGMAVFNRSMLWERTCLSAIHIGALDRLLERTVQYCRKRKSGGRHLGQYQSVAHKLARLKVDLEAGRSLLYRSAWAIDQRQSAMLMSSTSKVFISQMYEQAMLTLKQIYAGAAYRGRHELERNLRDSMAATIYSGTTEIQYNMIGRHLGL